MDTKLHVRRQPIAWHLFDVTVLSPMEQLFHVGRLGRKLVGLPVRALNLQDGHVPDSAFFTNRDPAGLSPEEVRWGPSQPDDIPVAPLVITKPKVEGKTAGFFVTDRRGIRYLLKFDPVGSPELLSGAEVATSKLLYALGYHVPSYEIAAIDADAFELAPDLYVKDARGERRPFTADHLQALLESRARDGKVRVVASKILSGEILGPARFKRFRDCAELRALKLAYAWLNNIDAKDHNSLLVWDGTKTVGYLIDFGTSLGADAGRGSAKDPCAGWTYVVDLKESSLELMTLGLRQSGCDVTEQPYDSSIGLLSPRVDPKRWKPYAPNLAFAEMNASDAEWMAQRLARLSRPQIAAAVSAAQYSDPADAAYLVDVLDQRREAIVKRYVEDQP